MRRSLRHFASLILLGHLLALAVIIGAVVLVARDVYSKARDKAIQQAVERQRLLTGQTARAIEGYYASIFSNLDLVRRDEQRADPRPEPQRPDPPQRTRTPLVGPAGLMWHQLEGRVSNLFGVTRQNNKVFASYPKEGTAEAQQIATDAKDWLAAVGSTSPAISPFGKWGDQWGHLLAIPVPAMLGSREGRLLLVAVVPIDPVDRRFLTAVSDDPATLPAGEGASPRRPTGTTVSLLDASGKVLASHNKDLVNMDLARDARDPRVRSLVAQAVPQGQRATEVIDESFQVGQQLISPRIVHVEPVKVAGQNWAVVVSSPLAEVDEIVGDIFRKAALWALIVVIAMTATLVSTAATLIRSRLREERLRNEMLARELEQARRIQLAWLPSRDVPVRRIDVAAVNEPASHVSGDFYDWFELPDGRIVVTIGDVTGHGISAAFLMATTQLLIRTTMLRLGDPGRCLEEVNRQLCSQVFNGQFVTVLIMAIDLSKDALEAATAGHFPPMVSDGRELRPLPMEHQLVLGVCDDETYPTERFSLSEHFTLLMYTDGVVDTLSPDGRRFTAKGIEQALNGQVAGGKRDSAQGVLQSLVRAVERFRGPQELGDDLTLVAVQAQAKSARTLAVAET